MKVHGQHYRSVWMKGNTVFMIDQTLLPFNFQVREYTSYTSCCDAIINMVVRGAGAIGAAAGYAMALAAIEAKSANYEEFINNARAQIEATRPTARDLFDSLEQVYEAALQGPEQAVLKAEELAELNAEAGRKIGQHGKTLIREGMGILTHCNAGWFALVDYGSALAPIYAARDDGKHFRVFVDETRPRGQGAKLTAWELQQEGIPHYIIPDNAAAWLMKEGKIDLVITGADRIAANGDTANKIGTLERAIAANYYNIPFYIAAPKSTFDASCPSGNDIKIEERDVREVTHQSGITEKGELEIIQICNPGSPVMNPAFDVTPAELISGFITEAGIVGKYEI